MSAAPGEQHGLAWLVRAREHYLRSRSQPPPRPSLSPAGRLIMRAIAELSGFERGVIYDVPARSAPRPRRFGSIYLHGSPEWQRFLWERRQVDDGELKPLIALRTLPDAERLHAVDWGSSYANALLLIEPLDPACDLTDPAGACYRELEQAAETVLAGRAADDAPALPWTRETALGDLLRGMFGVWTYWTGDRASLQSHQVRVQPERPGGTLGEALLPLLPVRFPQGAFDRTLAQLFRNEGELFRGKVPRACIPFRSRLGLPVLHDPLFVDSALRRLVNEGATTVGCYAENGPQIYGAGRPIPNSMTIEEFRRLEM